MSKLSRVLTALCLLVGLSAGVLAQSTTTGAIGVVVKDPNSAVVPGASVTAHNEETNQDASATTDSEGRARVVLLQPGHYTVTVSASGFSNYKQEQVVVEVGQVTSIDAPLALGNVGETGEVPAETPVINTT